MNPRLLSLLLLAGLMQACERPTASAPAAPAQEQEQQQVQQQMQPQEQEHVMVDETYALVGTAWWVEDILAAGVVDRSRTTLGFFEDNRVAGNSGCNRFTGGFEMKGSSMSFTPLAGTMMACPEALMNQERRFYDAMEQVTAWRIDRDTGLLHLENSEGETVLRASELPAGEAP